MICAETERPRERVETREQFKARVRDAKLRRARLAIRCKDDAKARAYELERCRRDPLHFIEMWCWTYDPRLIGRMSPFRPFVLFEKQRALIRFFVALLDEDDDGTVEKSRDMGFSWCAACFALWLWLFTPGAAVRFGSRKEAYVDTLGDPDSIFGKIRIALDQLPRWMRPPGFDPKRHDNHMLIRNPHNGAQIAGEGGDNIGRGGRAYIYFVDEFAFVARPAMVDSALSQNAKSIVYGSSANGQNYFYQKTRSEALKHFTLRWQSDPRKDQRWYDRQLAKYGPVVVAREVDIDYAAAVEGIAIPAAWVSSCIGLELPEGAGSTESSWGLDVADGGVDLSVLAREREGYVTIEGDRSDPDTTQTAQWAAGIIENAEAEEVDLYYDAIGIGAGISGELSRAPRSFRHHAVNVGARPSERVYDDGRYGHEKFANLKAELWSALRDRVEATHHWATEGRECDPGMLISLPDHPQLRAELSMPRAFFGERGKVRIESKRELAKRLAGAYKSPDYADAVVLCQARGIVNPGYFVGFL